MRKILDLLLRRAPRPPVDPLADLRQPVSDEDYWRLKREWQQEDMLDALRDGEHFIPMHANAAAGRGLSITYLCDMGLMKIVKVTPGGIRFAPTRKGAAYLREHS